MEIQLFQFGAFALIQVNIVIVYIESYGLLYQKEGKAVEHKGLRVSSV